MSVGYVLDLLSLYQRLEAFADVFNPYKDEIGISMEAERSPRRVSGDSYDRDY